LRIAPLGERGQCKWGRHCCRPHSHQRVDTLCSHDIRRTFRHVCCGAYLAPDVWPLHVGSCDLSGRDCSPALAPASGFRSCTAASFRSPKPPMVAALRSRLAEAVSLYRSGLAADPDLRPSLSPGSAKFAACPMDQLRSHLERASLHLAEASCTPSLDKRVDNHHRHPWDINFQNFKALRLFRSGCFVSRRQVESAPQPVIWQYSQAGVFHFSPDQLWTRVDKSTPCRI